MMVAGRLLRLRLLQGSYPWPHWCGSAADHDRSATSASTAGACRDGYHQDHGGGGGGGMDARRSPTFCPCQPRRRLQMLCTPVCTPMHQGPPVDLH